MTTQQKIIKNKIGLLGLAKHLGNVSQACKVFGFSRDNFYRFKQLYDNGGEEALQELNRRKPNLKNRVEEYVEKPAFGQQRVSNELKKEGILVCPASVRNIWIRYDLKTFKLSQI